MRDTDLLGYYMPAGTNVVTWPGMNHRLPELWTDPDEVRPGPLRRATQRTQEAPLRIRTRSAAARTSASAWSSASWRSRPIVHRLLRKYRLELVKPGYTPEMGQRRHAHADGRYANHLAPHPLNALRRQT